MCLGCVSRDTWLTPRPFASDGKHRLRWTPFLHERFVLAVNSLGGLASSTPKKVLVLMDVQGVTVQHVKSHLQKYRVQLAQEAGLDGSDATLTAGAPFLLPLTLSSDLASLDGTPALSLGLGEVDGDAEFGHHSHHGLARQASNVSSPPDFEAARVPLLGGGEQHALPGSAASALPPKTQRSRKAGSGGAARKSPGTTPRARQQRQQQQHAAAAGAPVGLGPSVFGDGFDDMALDEATMLQFATGDDLPRGLDLAPDFAWPLSTDCMADLLQGAFLDTVMEDMLRGDTGVSGQHHRAPRAPMLPGPAGYGAVPPELERHLLQLDQPAVPLVPLVQPGTLDALQPRTLAEMALLEPGLEAACFADPVTDALRTQAELHRQLSVHLERTKQLQDLLKESGRKIAQLQSVSERSRGGASM